MRDGNDWPREGSDIHAVSGATYPQKRRRIWPWVLGAVVLVALVVACKGVAGSDDYTPAPTMLPSDEASTPRQTLPPGTIPEGVWSVGVSGGVPSGTYRVAKAIQSTDLCYWQVSNDAEGTDIVKNDVPTGGTPQVTLTKGQWFKTQGCGDWVKR